ncbi:alpha/beta hydrolase [Pedosphaera parvula]|uniref:Serine aminopeptidase S33 domain-containing protein n=1 Tax=Pedosphaera parvula (strain Ellin514) TaxID=320771 RepID=B9XI54_PEDPL|nr:alpha/beta hydrolase [Pedosphaera parvula]EEF60547.1 conserved hypothetical protein [Pedosphaera parvula Ellin514]
MIRKFEYGQVYRPDSEFIADGTELGRPFQDIYFATEDGLLLNGWFFPADPNAKRSDMVMLVCHGNGGNLSHRLDLCRTLLQLGVSVMLFDYRGYGRSQGVPTEEGTYLDAQAAHQWLQKNGFAAGHILSYGESLGGGIASELAIREQVGGLILQSTFTSIPDVGAELFPWIPVRWLGTIKYNTLSKLPLIHVPVLVMHSRDDGLVRFRHSEKNFEAANEPKMFWEINGDHGYSLKSDHDRCAEGIKRFLLMVEAVQVQPFATAK